MRRHSCVCGRGPKDLLRSACDTMDLLLLLRTACDRRDGDLRSCNDRPHRCDPLFEM